MAFTATGRGNAGIEPPTIDLDSGSGVEDARRPPVPGIAA
jgi:hypothetical protein